MHRPRLLPLPRRPVNALSSDTSARVRLRVDSSCVSRTRRQVTGSTRRDLHRDRSAPTATRRVGGSRGRSCGRVHLVGERDADRRGLSLFQMRHVCSFPFPPRRLRRDQRVAARFDDRGNPQPELPARYAIDQRRAQVRSAGAPARLTTLRATGGQRPRLIQICWA